MLINVTYRVVVTAVISFVWRSLTILMNLRYLDQFITLTIFSTFLCSSTAFNDNGNDDDYRFMKKLFYNIGNFNNIFS
jgi:hypothetical protein